MRARLQRRHWLTPAILALVLLGVAVTGGFRTAPPVGTSEYGPSTQLEPMVTRLSMARGGTAAGVPAASDR